MPGAKRKHRRVEDIIWHEIHNAYRTRHALGMLSGIERTEAGKTIAIVDYKGIPHYGDPSRGDGAGLPGRYVRC